MISRHPTHVVIVGAGAAGLMAGRELARAGRQVTILEARDRCGGRIFPLPAQEFGYAAEGGAEFVHGAAPLTRGLLREAGLSFAPMRGQRWGGLHGKFAPGEARYPHAEQLHQALIALKTDLPVAEFLEARFAGRDYSELRRSVTRMVEGYDAADPRRASTFAFRDEWLDNGPQQGRIAEGYGALIDFLAAECRRHGAAIHLRSVVTAIDGHGGSIGVTCDDCSLHSGDAAILTVPLPLLAAITLPPAARAQAEIAAAQIGYGNVVKILLRFTKKFWVDTSEGGLADLSFLFSDAAIPTWWTQHPAPHAVLTGWLAGPRVDKIALDADALAETALVSLAEIFDIPLQRLKADLVASRAINWGEDRFARGAYSYATPATRQAQRVLRRPDGGGIFFAGEAIHGGGQVGTVEAALASGLESARDILAGEA